ncbi:MAG: salicylate 1-monooxygenase, partial [Alphaproteobacteria bacterium]|nr:salicylate 1-monooxygenase [Alphaproteobacteria bacterium]
MARKPRIAIIGGGIGGLTAAAALIARGFEAQVFERAPALSEVGAGIQIGPNGVRVLYAMGLKPQLDAFACSTPKFVSMAFDTARYRLEEPLSQTSVARYGVPYLTMHRADLYDALAGSVPGSNIHAEHICSSAGQNGETAHARFANGREIEADVIIGADGVRSAVRENLFGRDTPRYTGQTCFRAMVPMDAVPVSAGPDGVNMRIDNVGWIGPKGHVICYPIRAGKVLNIFAGFVNDAWTEESWTVPTSQDEMQQVFDGWSPILRELLAQSEAGYKWGLHDRDPMDSWTQGRITLLGDAAHPMMPTLAQGGCMAIEDGWSIARCIADHGDDLPCALQVYE